MPPSALVAPPRRSAPRLRDTCPLDDGLLGAATVSAHEVSLARPTQTSGAEHDTPRASARRVLVVDDQWDILESLELFLQAALPGVEVVLASSAREALDAIGERRVDLVITDLRMPGMDGLEFIRRLRQTQGELPVFLMTAYVQSELAEEAKRARDYQEFIAKPIDAGRLAALARDYLRA